MFELVRANKRRSVVLMLVMLALMLAVGYAIGFAVYPAVDNQVVALDQARALRLTFTPGGLIGMAVALGVWAVQALAAYTAGAQMLMAASGAKKLSKADSPQLFNVVEEMSIAAMLPKPPEIYLIEDMGLNAFAAGRDPEHASVAVTAGLLARLNRDQLQGVIAHEISHIVHRDVLYMTMMGVMAGTIIMLTDLFYRMTARGLRMSGTRRYRSSKSQGGGAYLLVLFLVALVLMIVAPLLAQLIYFACSRRREYLADAGAAVLTRYPEGLASALEEISGNAGLETKNRVTAPMYIINPLTPEGASLSSLTSTHPPVEKRIAVLRGMAGGVSYKTYADAWGRLEGGGARMPATLLAEPGAAPAARPAARPASGADHIPLPAAAAAVFQQPRPAAEPDTPQIRVARARDAGDLVRRMNNFLFITCPCGAKLKIPPEYAHPRVRCPRCHAVHSVASARAGMASRGST
ncbi:MAG TPA: M48 family metalloprotease [Candidatus Hydrogenedentes bacterium]|nr:M48 family metalloprotease [Candidatus Hydrogenedentota bacterium]